ncbi:TPA: hypothetical protein PXP39_004224 [Yersinia enterocolitica]|nr:hypothetical protein [Yersinia enterocolitica]HDL7834267.1 hypothetical protein [Yersinia enterocolitica]HDL7875119.1 hypothetical protein [Yersinia enterocolitica]HDL7887691.1 hypothetical protein [Yersinia enterocolitica]HDL7896298.1 hypothetical protein [Yersinia enterocolitica]
MCDEIDQAQKLELLNIKIGIANLKPAMTFTGRCHFSECRQSIARGLFCDAGCRDDYEIDERRKGIAA